MTAILIVLATAVAAPAAPAAPDTPEQSEYRQRRDQPRATDAVRVHGGSEGDTGAGPDSDNSRSTARSDPPALAAPQTVSTNFTGATFAESGFVPPDSMGAAGPTQYLIGINGRIRVFDKATTAVGPLDMSMNDFFASVRNNSDVADPRVRFDRLSGRWIVVAISKAAINRVLVAVSSGSHIAGRASFTFFFFRHDDVGPKPNTDTGYFADYPTLGVDAHALYIGVNVFDRSADPDILINTTAFVVRKSVVGGTGGGDIAGVVTAFRDLIDPPVGGFGRGVGPFTPQGVDNLYVTNPDIGYFIGVDNAAFDRLILRRVTDSGTSQPKISGNIVIPLRDARSEIVRTSPPVDVPRPTGELLDGTDDRLLSATLRNGRLWTSHSIAVDASGTAVHTGADRRNGSRWYELRNLENPETVPTLVQHGTLFDPAATNPRHYWIPGVNVSGQGHMALGASVSGATAPTDAVTAGRLASDPAGTLQAPVVYTASSPAFTYNRPTNPPNIGGQRWGDYSYTSLDPVDDMTMWTIQEFVNANDSWGVQVARLMAPPPAAPTAASPATVVSGQASVDVTVNGSSAGGAGFYDPGTGFPSRLTAAVSGGVTVNSATYVNPTTINLNLDTTSATPGTKSVTVTNPDGQNRTAAVLNVASTTPPITSSPTTSPAATSPPTTSPVTTPPTTTEPSIALASAADGYRLVARDGGIFSFGRSSFLGSTGAITLNRPIVGMASSPSGNGYWLVASDGGIFAFGDARFFGSTGAITLNRPIVGMASTPSGNGYWLVASDGGIFAFGDAAFRGSTGALRLTQPILGMASTPSGNGYWLVASDGGIFAFGDAGFFGSTGALRLAQPIVGMSL